MPSYARKHQLSQSLVYHLFNRSNARAQIFNSAEDYLHFMRLVKGYSETFNLKIYHWAIMHNHYHLLLEIGEPEHISKFMAGLNRSYTHYHHKKYLTSGFLWQGRFKLRPVQRDRYMLACGRYIERNPVHAGIVLEAISYPYSSAQFYCLGKKDMITCEDPGYVEFGTTVKEKQLEYKAFLDTFDYEEEKIFSNFDSPFGDASFARRLIKENGRYLPRRKGRVPKRFVS